VTYKSRHFKPSETDCKCGCGAQIKEETLKLADMVRDQWTEHLIATGRSKDKAALNCNSGARCMNHTIALRSLGIPAALKSAHLEGLAIDLCPLDDKLLAEFQDFCERNIPMWVCRMEDKRFTEEWVHLDLRGVGIFTPG
jgi:hypothetical protein